MGVRPNSAGESAQAEDRPYDVAVVIRLDADAERLERCIEAYQAQRGAGTIEILIVSPGPNAAARAAAEGGGARWLEGPPDALRGLLINRGVEAASAEYVVLTSANALPVGPDFLRRAVETLAEDPTAAAARCLQLTNAGQAASWARPKRIAYRDEAERKLAESNDGWAKDYPADDCCIIRRSVWEGLPFDEEAEAHEDKIWASQALGRGHSVIACAPCVWLQQQPPSQTERRRRILREKRALFQLTRKPSMSWGAFVRSAVSTILRSPAEAVRQAISTIAFNYKLASIPRQSRSADTRLAAALRGESRE
jgi:hypothetical protein